MPQPRILHLTGMKSTKYGALESYILESVRQCNARGVKSIVQYEEFPHSKYYLDELEKLGAEVVVVKTLPGTLKNILSSVLLIGKVRPSYVISHFIATRILLATALSAHALGCRSFTSFVHNVHHLTPESRSRIAYNRATFLLGVSEAVRQDLLNGAVAPEKVARHYLGLISETVNTDELRQKTREEFGYDADDVVLANIAFDAPFKGVDTLVHAMALLSGDIPKIKLLQIGVDPEKSKLPSLVTELGLMDRIRFAGIVDDGWKLLAASDLYIQPSRFGEGLPLAIMEAMRFSIPVVATTVAGNVEAVVDEKTGLLCAPDSPRELADTVLKMIATRSKWKEYGENANERYRTLFDGRRSVTALLGNYVFKS